VRGDLSTFEKLAFAFVIAIATLTCTRIFLSPPSGVPGVVPDVGKTNASGLPIRETEKPPEVASSPSLSQAGPGHTFLLDAHGEQPQAFLEHLSLEAMREYDVDLEAQPGLEGLEALTIGQWCDGDFAEMTLEGARALLGEGTLGYDLSGRGLLADRLDGLPTAGDCEQAMSSPGVRAALRDYFVAEHVQVELAFVTSPTRGAAYVETKRVADQAKDAAEWRLMAALEQAGGYRHWQLLDRLFQEWIR